MIRFILFSCLLLTIHNGCRAQLLHTPTFIDNTLVNSPASLGALQKEGIRVSMFSYGSGSFFPFPPSLNAVLPRSFVALSALSVRRFYALSYHTSQTLPNDAKVTIGLQLQIIKLNRTRVSSPNTYGVTINYHKPLVSNERIESFFSYGVQMNIIHDKPSRTITSYAFNNLISMPTIDLDAFHKQFSQSGFQYTVNLGWLRYKKERSILAIGLSGSSVESKNANSFGGTTSGSFSFDSEVRYDGQIFLNGQFTSGGRFMLDFNLLFGVITSANSIGIGFKLKKHKVVRITAVNVFYLNNIDGASGSGLVLTLDASKFSYNLHINDFTFSRVDSTIQIGATYKMSQEGHPTLLNQKY